MKRYLLVLFAALYILADTTELRAQAAQQACNGLKNPINFILYTSDQTGRYSGATGRKDTRRSTCSTPGMTFNADVSTMQMANESGGSSCYNQLGTDYMNRFVIKSAGTDALTSNQLSYLPPDPSFTRSIRLGNACGGAQAEALYYDFRVTFDNALITIWYSISLYNALHSEQNGAPNPEFGIRVKRKVGNTYVNISDTLCNVVPSPLYSTSLGQFVMPNNNNVYKPWAKVVINLYNFLYQDLRIEVMTGDCSYSAHYGYCYIAGECQPMRLEANGCAAGETEDIGRISAPKGLSAYQWYKSRTGFLTGTAAQDPRNYVPIPNETDSILNVTVDHLTTANGDTVAQQSFMCEMTSYMNPEVDQNGNPLYPIKSQLFTDVMNKKPKLALDTILECNSMVTLIDRSQAPIIETASDNVDTSLTQWTIYGDRDTMGAPVYTGSGGKATYTFPQAGMYAVTVRTSARDTTCWNKKTVLVRAIAPINPGFEFERNDLCFRDIIAIGDTTTGSEWRRWVLHNRDGSTDTLADTARTIHISFDDTTLVELIAAARPADVTDGNGNRIQKLCPNTASKTIRVGRYPRLQVVGDTIVCIGSSGDINVSTDVEGCTFEWYDAMGANAPFSSSTHITVSPRRSTWYYVKVTTHPNECFTWDSIFVRVVDPTLAASTHQICVGDTVWLTATNAYSYSWSANPRDNDLEHWNNDSVTHPVIFVTPEVTTTYTMVGHGSNGCNSNPLTETITVYPYPIPKVDYTPTFVDSEDPSVTFHDLSQYGVRTLWNFGDGSTSTMKDATYSFTDISRDSVCVSLFSFNTLGCVSDTTFCLPVVLFSAWLPNTFTPALGGENAFFRIYSGNTLEHFSMFIYDRAGRMVYRSHDQYEGWDGTNLNGDDCLEGIYVYVCSYRRPNTTDITTRKGAILLIR